VDCANADTLQAKVKVMTAASAVAVRRNAKDMRIGSNSSERNCGVCFRDRRGAGGKVMRLNLRSDGTTAVVKVYAEQWFE
jgi:hypothetical protein